MSISVPIFSFPQYNMLSYLADSHFVHLTYYIFMQIKRFIVYQCLFFLVKTAYIEAYAEFQRLK